MSQFTDEEGEAPGQMNNVSKVPTQLASGCLDWNALTFYPVPLNWWMAAEDAFLPSLEASLGHAI